jgi:hypothetical protein
MRTPEEAAMRVRANEVPGNNRDPVREANIGRESYPDYEIERVSGRRSGAAPDIVLASERHGELDHLVKNDRATEMLRKSDEAKARANDTDPPRKRIIYGTAIIWGWDSLLDMSADLPRRYQPSDFEFWPRGRL